MISAIFLRCYEGLALRGSDSRGLVVLLPDPLVLRIWTGKNEGRSKVVG
jgi:hypothetical protein